MRNRLLFFIILISANMLVAQNTINSPFSSYGFGERSTSDDGIYTGIGNSTITYFDSTVLNYYNPASYSSYGKGQPLFSVGISSRVSTFSENGAKQVSGTAFIDHFAMGFTLKQKYGLAFGLRPFSSKGYDITQREAVGAEDSVMYNYTGKGNGSEVFLGLSYALIRTKKSYVSVGANLGYLFGGSTNERTSVMSTNSTTYGGIYQNTVVLQSFHYELAAIVQQQFRDNHMVALTAVIEPAQKITAQLDQEFYYGLISDPSAYDTLMLNEGQKGHFNLGTTASFGLNYNFHFLDDNAKRSYTKNSELGIHLMYSSTDWSSFSSTFNTTEHYLSTSKLTFGIQYKPEYNFMSSSTSVSFFDRVRYRAGAYYYTLPYASNGKQVYDNGVTIGFGIPIITSKSVSSVNFSLSKGIRTNGVSTDLKESYTGISLGIVIAPGNYERWFLKRKLD